MDLLNIVQGPAGVKALRKELYVLVSKFRVLDALDEGLGVGNEACPCLDAGEVPHMGKVAEPVLGIPEFFSEGVCAPFVYEVVGVDLCAVGPGEGEHLRADSLGEHDFQGAEGGFLACSIAVEDQVGGFGVAG